MKLDLFVYLKYQSSTIILSVGIKYSVHILQLQRHCATQTGYSLCRNPSPNVQWRSYTL